VSTMSVTEITFLGGLLQERIRSFSHFLFLRHGGVFFFGSHGVLFFPSRVRGDLYDSWIA